MYHEQLLRRALLSMVVLVAACAERLPAHLDPSDASLQHDAGVLDAVRDQRLTEDFRAAADMRDSEFESFTLSHFFGPCPIENGDCGSFIELSASGKLRVDRVGEGDGVIHESTISAGDLQRALAVLTDPDLRTLLAAKVPPCVLVLDSWETMTLIIGGITYTNGTTNCKQEELAAARETMRQLKTTYLPTNPTCGDRDVMNSFEKCSQSTTAETCQAAGGQWAPISDETVRACVCPTGQAGCDCEKPGDCQNSPCVADLIDSAETNRCSMVRGTCAAFAPLRGCYCVIHGDGTATSLCTD